MWRMCNNQELRSMGRVRSKSKGAAQHGGDVQQKGEQNAHFEAFDYSSLVLS